MDQAKFWVGLNNFPKFGPVRFKKLLKFFPDMAAAFNAPIGELIKAGIEENIAQEFAFARQKINPDLLMQTLAAEKIKIVRIFDEEYPKLLKELYAPPALLYYKGSLDINNDFIIAVVGARKYTDYGRRITSDIVKKLALNKLCIASGLALGIDALAHAATLEAKGKTVAVLGSGLDRKNIYPSQNRFLAEKIVGEGGLLLSEFPIGTPPLRHHFPQRNRIISGMSLGVLVIEAGEKSGALITARYALEQNREVFAIPGSIYSDVSAGTNLLIKEGAKPITSANDIIESFNLDQAIAYIENKKIIPESEEEKKIIACLSFEPVHIDELIRGTGLKANEIGSALSIMEIKGMIKNLGGMNYVLAR